MSILGNLGRFFFQKRGNAFGGAEAERRNDMRYNALYALDPDVLVRHLAAFARGDICGLERVLEEFEGREDKMRIGAFKMAAAVASKPWEVRVAKGEEENPRAARHKEVLTRFWNRAVATDAFCRNRKGGVRLLVKQMMGAQSRVYSVHDIVWKVHGDGSLSAEFTHVPAWCFENRSGRLRYIRNDGDSRGEEMRDGEWMVTVGEGVGIAAAILAMAKRLSWNDWLLFSEKCGMPVIMGNTSAQRGSPAWKAMEKAIKAIAPKTGLLADTGTQLNAVSMGGSGKDTYRDLVDTVDRAISALYRGGDLATVSSVPSAAGVNAQQGESELMDADGCAMVSETLRDQVERFVVRFECGDEVPLAGIVINPPAETLDTEREIRIDQHLAALGVQLSKADALARYGRAEAKEEGDALKAGGDAAPPAAAVDGRPPAGGFGGFRQALHNERKGEASPLLRAFAKDTGPAAARMEALLERLDAGEDVTAEARKLAGELPGLMKGEPEMAAVLEEEMARAFAEGLGGGGGGDEATKGRGDEGGGLDDLETLDLLGNRGLAMANEQMRGKTSPESNAGSFAPEGTGGAGDGGKDVSAPENQTEKRQRECREALEVYKASNDHPSADDVASGKVDIRTALKRGFEAEFGGQKVIFFTQRLSDKYEGRGEAGRLGLIRHALEVRTNMFPTRHSGGQTGLVERLTRKNAGRRLVVTADRETGIAVNVMRCSDEYIRKHYK